MLHCGCEQWVYQSCLTEGLEHVDKSSEIEQKH